MIDIDEIWKKLIYPLLPDGNNHFEISNNGRLKNTNTGNILKPSKLKSGYYSVRVNNGDRKHKIHIIIHRAVAHTFVANPNHYDQVNHIDGNKENNKSSNLEWCTQSMNMNHAYMYGLNDIKRISGINNHSSKLNWDIVKYIREHFIKGDREYGCRPLARKFGVSHPVILNVLNNTTWKINNGA